MVLNIQASAKGFTMLVTFEKNGVQYPIRQLLSKPKECASLFDLCSSDKLLFSLWNNEKIFFPVDISKNDLLHILNNVDTYTANGVSVRLPKSIQRKSKMLIQAQPQNSRKISTKISLDGIVLDDNDLKEIVSKLENLFLLRGSWYVVDSIMVKKIYDKIKSSDLKLSDILYAMHEKDDNLKSVEIAMQNMPILKPYTGRLDVFNAILREYQSSAVKMLYSGIKQGLNYCLADDMGLGKTVQIIALLNMLQCDGNQPNLIVVPKSLVGNWESEFEKHSPNIKYRNLISNMKYSVEHSAFITTYGNLVNNPEFYQSINWNLVILDEAQQIKNADTTQSKACCALKSRSRIAMTGTPIENSLIDLWSLFLFVEPGLLGTKSQFSKIESNKENYKMIQDLISPYMIRRVKTDKSIISDLPDKKEQIIRCELTGIQKSIYNGIIGQFEHELKLCTGTTRKTTILKFLNSLKQTCNHPLSVVDGNFQLSESGKMCALRSYITSIPKGEKIIVFTQYVTMANLLNLYLSRHYNQAGLVIDGSLSSKRRKECCKLFQEGDYPYIVLTLKSGGTGLNLTSANHVIHFDRWWNPSVENQASDRAFRIGQTKDVHVVKFVSNNTLEERIEELMVLKSDLFANVISPLNMSNNELLQFVKSSV